MSKQENSFDKLPERVEQISSQIERLEKIIQGLLENKGANSPDELLDVKQAGEFLGLKVSTLYSKVSKGEIPVSKRGQKLIFSKARLIEWSLKGEREDLSEKRKAHIEKMQRARKGQK